MSRMQRIRFPENRMGRPSAPVPGLAFDPERSELPRRGRLLNQHLPHLGIGRPPSTPGNEKVDCRRCSLGHGFHIAVAPVANPTGYPKTHCLILGALAEKDALNLPLHPEDDALLGRSFHGIL